MMDSQGTFNVGSYEEIFEKEATVEPEIDVEIMQSLLEDFEESDEDSNYELHEIISSTLTDEALREINRAMELDQQQPIISLPVTTKPRFKTLSEEEVKDIEDSRQAKATKTKTKWGIKILQDWSMEKFGKGIDFYTIESVELCNLLRHFYAEVQPKPNPRKPDETQEYHKNSLKAILSSINRHLGDIGRNIDIVRDKAFKTANATLDGKLKMNVKSGLSRPTKHKAIINPEDLQRICNYLTSAENPVILRYRVWYDLSIHFVSRGLEFHQQLTTNSFEFLSDENDIEYVVMSHETKQKNRQGGLDSEEASHDKRMYATGDPVCPVRSLRKLIQLTDPQATSLFNHCSKEALASPNTATIWYTPKSVKQYQFSKFMSDICRNSKCTQSYTAHCLRSTAIQALGDDGFEVRHIMFMSGRKNEASVRSYSRDCSTHQKLSLSSSLARVARPTSALVSADRGPSATVSRPPADTNQDVDEPRIASAYPDVSMETTNQPCTPLRSLNVCSNTTQQNTGNFMSGGFISNSTFQNCTFQFAGNPFASK